MEPANSLSSRNSTCAAFPPFPSMGKLVSTAGSFAATNTRTKPGARKCCPLMGETKDTNRPLCAERSDPTATVAWLVTELALFDAVSVNVRVPLTLATREVVPVTSPIPLLIFNPAAPVTLQCSVTFPLVGNVAALAANERICGGAFDASRARKNPFEFCSVMEIFVCPGVVRRYGVQANEGSRVARRSIWYTGLFAALRIDTCNWFESQPMCRMGAFDCARTVTFIRHRNEEDRSRATRCRIVD